MLPQKERLTRRRINVPIIKVSKTYLDVATKEEISQEKDFIEGIPVNDSLTPNTCCSYIIQIQSLENHNRNILEKVLSIFMSNKFKSRTINFTDENYPEKYRTYIHRISILTRGADRTSSSLRTATKVDNSPLPYSIAFIVLKKLPLFMKAIIAFGTVVWSGNIDVLRVLSSNFSCNFFRLTFYNFP